MGAILGLCKYTPKLLFVQSGQSFGYEKRLGNTLSVKKRIKPYLCDKKEQPGLGAALCIYGGSFLRWIDRFIYHHTPILSMDN
jgi:hypothetical protein